MLMALSHDIKHIGNDDNNHDIDDDDDYNYSHFALIIHENKHHLRTSLQKRDSSCSRYLSPSKKPTHRTQNSEKTE